MSKLKELKRRSTIAWSISNIRPDLIAAGTMAGTVGDEFDTSAQLEIFSLDLESSDQNLTLVGKTASPYTFHKIVWGQSGNGKYGILAGGMDNGSITIWDPSKISAAEGPQAGCIGNAQKHKGPVQALDFNPFQQNLLASGATESEIFIWDLGKPGEPTVYTPGAKPQQVSDIANVAWNKKVQHILASTQFSGTTVIWDLKAKKPVISFADRNSKARSKSIAWHPAEATQILTASEEDDAPALQMWYLRNVFTPVRTFNGHSKGVWGVSWSPFDHSLVLSCGKDGRTLCWNSETAEMLCEVEGGGDSSAWNIDVQWSPRMPAVLSTYSLEGKVNIFALQDVCERTLIASESFDGAQMQQPPSNKAAPKYTPNWLQRPCGVAFGFGGRLVSFEKSKDPKAPNRAVTVSSVVTDKDVLNRSEKLDEAVSSGQFTQFCDEKIASATQEDEKTTWSFLRVLFDSDARHKILNYLGFDEAMTQQEIKDFINSLPAEKIAQLQAEQEKEKEPSPPPTRRSPTPPSAPTAEETETKEGEQATEDEGKQATEDEGEKENKDVAGLFGAGGDEFSSFSFEQQQHQHAHHDDNQRIDAQDHSHHDHPHHDHPHHDHPHHDHPHHDHSQDHDHAHHAPAPQKKTYTGPPIEIPTSEAGPESIITKALLIGNFEAAVQCCLRLDRVADALVIAAAGGKELWERTQEAYFARQTHSYARVMSSVVRGELREIVEHSVLRDWKATLATLCTYTKSSDFPVLCSVLGDRLEQANDLKAAILCYICAGSIDKAVGIWVRSSNTQKNPQLVLQDLIEKISIFRQAVGDRDDLNELLSSKYGEYAGILASQGRVQSALRYLDFLNDPKYSNTSGAVLLDRAYHSSTPSKTIQEPAFPFKRVEVYAQGQQLQPQAAAQPQRTTPAAYPPTHTPGAYPPTHPTSSYPTHPQPHVQTQPHAHTTAHAGHHNVHQHFAGASHTYAPPPPSMQYTPTQYPPATHGTHGSPSTNPAMTSGPVAPPPLMNILQPTPPQPQPHALAPQTTAPPPPMHHTAPLPPPAVPQQTHTAQPSSYAPPPMHQQVQPPTVFTPTPPASTRPHSPPPTQTPPPPPASSVPATAPKAQEQAPVSQDTSFLVTSLQNQMANAQANAARQPQLKAKGDDMTKRLGQLTDRLAKPGAVSAQAVDGLTALFTALNQGDSTGASSALVKLSTGANDVGPSAVIGLKALITLSKA